MAVLFAISVFVMIDLFYSQLCLEVEDQREQ